MHERCVLSFNISMAEPSKNQNIPYSILNKSLETRLIYKVEILIYSIDLTMFKRYK